MKEDLNLMKLAYKAVLFLTGGVWYDGIFTSLNIFIGVILLLVTFNCYMKWKVLNPVSDLMRYVSFVLLFRGIVFSYPSWINWITY